MTEPVGPVQNQLYQVRFRSTEDAREAVKRTKGKIKFVGDLDNIKKVNLIGNTVSVPGTFQAQLESVIDKYGLSVKNRKYVDVKV